MCVICRQKFEKKAITRYVYSPNILEENFDETVAKKKSKEKGGALTVDATQTRQGRGYYVCNSLECQQKYSQRGSVKRKRKGV